MRSLPWKVLGTTAPVKRLRMVVLATPLPRACLECWAVRTM